MNRREPTVELLLKGGELLDLSPLRYGPLRTRMLDALHHRLPMHAQLGSTEPAVALIEALAACIDVVGFYHDRFATESKLGAAALLQSMARLGEVVGYRPRPPLAAVAYQFFLAVSEGQVPAGFKISGTAGSPPQNIVFETRSSISISPAFNLSRLSPIVTRYARAVRAVLRLLNSRIDETQLASLSAALGDALRTRAEQQLDYAAMPLDDLCAGTLAMVNGSHGLELCRVASSRRRGVAFETPLVRSYDASTTVLSRSSCVRHLRFWRPLGEVDTSSASNAPSSPEQVVFEITDRPILHFPNPSSPEQLSSSLEVFVFDNSDQDVGDPTTWNSKVAWTQVADFSSSEASDPHYRVIVDDRLTSYLVLRRRLGYRTLLDDAALARVYVRFVPAIGRTIELGTGSGDGLPFSLPAKLSKLPEEPDESLFRDAKPPSPIELVGTAMTLDPNYFENALVRPEVVDATVRNESTWAVTSEDMELQAGAHVAIQGAASGKIYFRTLTAKTHGRYLSWAKETDEGAAKATSQEAGNEAGTQLSHGATTSNEVQGPEIDDIFEAAKTTIVPLADIARGQTIPLWEAYYKQARAPDETGVLRNELSTWLPSGRLTLDGTRCYLQLPKGSTFLLLEDSSHLKSGDYLLVGRRLRRDYQDPKPDGNEEPSGWEGGPPYFDERLPWLTAEVVQAVEVQGNLVRLRDPISQDYYRDHDEDRNKWATDVVVVAAVSSVYYGDCFVQPVRLDNAKTFVFKTPSVDSEYIRVTLDNPLSGPALREALGWQSLYEAGQWRAMLGRLFVGIGGEVTDPLDLTLSRKVTVPARGLHAEHVDALILPSPQRVISVLPLQISGFGEFSVELDPANAHLALDAPADIVGLLNQDSTDLRWERRGSGAPPSVGEFEASNCWYFLPDSPSTKLDEPLLNGGGILLLAPSEGSPLEVVFTWFPENGTPSQRGLFVTGSAPEPCSELGATAVSRASTLKLGDLEWVVQWRIRTHFVHTEWFQAAYEKTLVLGSRSGVPEPVESHIGSQVWPVSFPIVSGKTLRPLDGTSEVWALPTESTFSVAIADLAPTVWTLPLPASVANSLGTSWNGFMAAIGPDAILAITPASSVGTRALSCDLNEQLCSRWHARTEVRVLTEVPIDARRRVWILDPVGASLPRQSSKLVALYDTRPGDVQPNVELAQFLAIRDARMLVRPDEDKPPPTQATCVVRCHDQPVSFESKRSQSFANGTTTLVIPLPSEWPRHGSTPIVPAPSTLFGRAGTSEIWTAVSTQVDPNANTCTLTFVGELGSWSELHLGLEELKAPSLTVAEVPALQATSLPWTSELDQELKQTASLWVTPALELRRVETLRFEGEPSLIVFGEGESIPSQGITAYWCHAAWRGSDLDTLEVSGETAIQIGSGVLTALSITTSEFEQLHYFAFGSEQPWRTRTIASGSIEYDNSTESWSLKLEGTLFGIFSGGLGESVPLRFAYDKAAVQPTDTCIAHRLGTLLPVDQLLPLGVLQPTSRANAVVFSKQDAASFHADLTLPIAPVDAQGGLQLSGDAVLQLFDQHSMLQFVALGLAQHWNGLAYSSLSVRSTLLRLGAAPFHDVPTGKPLQLQIGDELAFTDDAWVHQLVAPIHRVADDGAYEIDAPTSFDRVRLRSVKVATDVDAFSVTANAALPSEHRPWLITGTRAVTAAQRARPISETLLKYDTLRREVDGRYTVRFSDREAVRAILASPEPLLYVYRNNRQKLREDLYLANLEDLESKNLLKTLQTADELWVNRLSNPFPIGGGPEPSVLLCDIDMAADGNWALSSVEFRTLHATPERLEISVLSQSIVFNSGNFVPVTGANAGADSQVMASALRVFLTFGDRVPEQVLFDQTSQLTEILKSIENGTYDYDSPGPKYLYNFTKLPGGTFVLNFLFLGLESANALVFVEYGAPLRRLASEAGISGVPTMLDPTQLAELSVQEFSEFAPEKLAGLTLEQLAAVTAAQLRVLGAKQLRALSNAQMAALSGTQLAAFTAEQLSAFTAQQLRALSLEQIAEQSDEVSRELSRLYQFETAVAVLDPASQLVVLDSGGLKADDYVFLHAASGNAGQGAPKPIQPTRISSVAGPIVSVGPRISFEIESFYDYFLCRYSRPAKPASLDKEYYALLKTAVFAVPPVPPPAHVQLPVSDRLIIDPNQIENQALLAALVPGDPLLIWDERYRQAWHAKRVASGTASASWPEFAQYQYVATIKSVDADSGLVILSEPLPERFTAELLIDGDSQSNTYAVTLAPTEPRLRVLPHYSAPFQGKRTMKVLGSGNKNRKFAQYTTTLDPNFGLGTIPLFSEKMYASNVEVLSREPRSGEWSRWVQFLDIDRAERKDRAFTLGLDQSTSGAERLVPATIGFGDGSHGQVLPSGEDNVYVRATSIGESAAHFETRRPLRILAAWLGAAPFVVPPEAAAVASNLWLRVEFGGHLNFSPRQGVTPERPLADSTGADWRSALRIQIGDRVWPEINRAEAEAGYEGMLVCPARPGVVDVFFFASRTITFDAVGAWEAVGSAAWILDSEFYASLESSDPTRLEGATRIGLLETNGIRPGSLLALSHGEGTENEIVQIESVDRDTWSATFASGLKDTYALATSTLQGNIVEVVQGSTESFTLGSGDGSTRSLRLPLYNRAPLLYAYEHGKTAPEPRIAVTVDGVAWRRVDDFSGCLPRDRVWRLDVGTDAKAFVVFGDGMQGAVPPFGTNNISAAIGTGNGEAGDLPVKAIDKLRDRSLAIKQTWNLTEASGGKQGETVGEMRETLLNRKGGIQNIVSAEDAARVVLDLGEVLHARVDPTAPRDQLALVVVLEQRRKLTEQARSTLCERIQARLPATFDLEVNVSEATQVAVHLAATIEVSDGYLPAAVLEAVELAFAADTGFFAPARWPIGEPIRLGDVYESLFAVAGVASAQVTWLSTEKLDASRTVVQDLVNPGVRGVIRCDNDPLGDPHQQNGSIQFDLGGGS